MRVLARSAIWLAYCAVRHSPEFKLADDVKFKIDPVLCQSGSSSAFVLRQWAEPELRYLDQFLPRGGTFIDCGANVGIFTACGAGIVGERGKVISVEPAVLSFARLKRNIDLNGFSQVELIRKAISDRNSVARLYHADGGPVAFSLVCKTGVPFEEVETTSIDHLVKEFGIAKVDCIKLDVEGVEVSALVGARNTLFEMRPTVIFERTSPGARRTGAIDEVPKLLLSHGYKLYRYRAVELMRCDYSSPNIVAIHPARSCVIPAGFISWTLDNYE